jgi:ankyrin repeat protein
MLRSAVKELFCRLALSETKANAGFLFRSHSYSNLQHLAEEADKRGLLPKQGCALLLWAIEGAHKEDPPRSSSNLPTGRFRGPLLTLLLAFLGEFIEKCAKVREPLSSATRLTFGNAFAADGYQSLAAALAHFNEADLIRSLSSLAGGLGDLDGKGTEPQHAPLYVAYQSSCVEAFEALLSCGADASRLMRSNLDGRPLQSGQPGTALFHLFVRRVLEVKDKAEARRNMVQLCLDKDRNCANLRCYFVDADGDRMDLGPLEIALRASDFPTVKALLEAGAQYGTTTITPYSKPHAKARRVVTATCCVFETDPPIFEWLIKEKRLLEDWQSWAEDGQEDLTMALTTVGSFVSMFPGQNEDPCFRVSTLLEGGFTRVHDSHGENLLIFKLFPTNMQGSKEENILTALKLFQKYLKPGNDRDLQGCNTSFLYDGAKLIHHAALRGYTKIIEWALEELGCGIDDVCFWRNKQGWELAVTPLTVALAHGQFEAARLLLSRGARPVLETVPARGIRQSRPFSWNEQPLIVALRDLPGYNPFEDSKCLTLLKLMAARDKNLLKPDYYKHSSPASTGSFVNPLTWAILSGLPLSAHWLVTRTCPAFQR